MGLNIPNCGRSSGPGNYPAIPPNPNPARFDIIDLNQVGKHCVVMVYYPGCTTFDGRKILVYENTKIPSLRKLSEIDPHFFEGSKLVARFRADSSGWVNATNFAKGLK